MVILDNCYKICRGEVTRVRMEGRCWHISTAKNVLENISLDLSGIGKLKTKFTKWNMD